MTAEPPAGAHWLITRDYKKGDLGSLGHVCRCEIGADHETAGVLHRLKAAPDAIGIPCRCGMPGDHNAEGVLQ